MRSLFSWFLCFIDKDIALYKKQRLLEVDQCILDAKSEAISEKRTILKQVYEDLSEAEHEYHYQREQRGIEIAALEARICAFESLEEARLRYISTQDELIKQKNGEILRLEGFVRDLIKSTYISANDAGF